MPDLLRMVGIIPAQASHCPYTFRRQRGEQQPDVDNIVGNLALSENIASNDFGLLCLGYVAHTVRQDRLSVVCPAVFAQKAD
jgi:hypothetical protein